MKFEVRQEMLAAISRVSLEKKKQSSQSILNQLKVRLKNETGCWAGFMPLSNEPQISFAEIPNINWVYPKINSETTELQFVEEASNFQFQEKGFKEPIDGKTVKLQDITGFCIPGLAFDKHGARLGRGAGYYDRVLKNRTKNKIGICYEATLVKELPTEAHDIFMNEILTETQHLVVSHAKEN